MARLEKDVVLRVALSALGVIVPVTLSLGGLYLRSQLDAIDKRASVSEGALEELKKVVAGLDGRVGLGENHQTAFQEQVGAVRALVDLNTRHIEKLDDRQRESERTLGVR